MCPQYFSIDNWLSRKGKKEKIINEELKRIFKKRDNVV